MLRTAALLVFTMVALSGCSDSTPDAGDPIEVTPGTGAIRGVVVDEAIRPIAEALIEVVGTGKSVRTGEDGSYVIAGLEPGVQIVRASHPLYDAVQQTVTVQAGVADPPATRFQLTRLIFAEPYSVTTKFDGFIVCSIGASLFASEECGEGVGVPCEVPEVGCQRHGGQGNSEVQYDFTLDGPNAKTIVVEQTWEPSSDATGELYTVLATEWKCVPSCSGREHNVSEGPSPLTLRMEQRQLEGMDNLTSQTVFSTFTWPAWGGSTDDPTQLNVAVNQPFEMFVSVFYNLPAPEGWSFVAGDPRPF